jgi:hypothetical protein
VTKHVPLAFIAFALATQTQAEDGVQLAIELANLQQLGQQDLDAATFLKHFQDVRSTDPEFEDKVAILSATYPEALRDKAAKMAVTVKQTVRNYYLGAMKQGGAYEFPEGPARETFRRTFDETENILAAKADAAAVDKGEKQIKEFVSQGLLTEKDFDTSGWAKGGRRPEIFKSNGQIDYGKAAMIAAQRTGKAAKAQETDETK